MDPITAIANVVSQGLRFIPNPNAQTQTFQTNAQIEAQRKQAELDASKRNAKLTTGVIYSVVVLAIIAVVYFFIIKKRS